MDIQARMEMWLKLADEAGLPVRREALGGSGGGLCRVRGEAVLFVDISADEDTQYEKTLGAMATLGDWNERYLPPEMREDLERVRGR